LARRSPTLGFERPVAMKELDGRTTPNIPPKKVTVASGAVRRRVNTKSFN
jgi:hypothetical protein